MHHPKCIYFFLRIKALAFTYIFIWTWTPWTTCFTSDSLISTLAFHKWIEPQVSHFPFGFLWHIQLYSLEERKVILSGSIVLSKSSGGNFRVFPSKAMHRSLFFAKQKNRFAYRQELNWRPAAAAARAHSHQGKAKAEGRVFFCSFKCSFSSFSSHYLRATGPVPRCALCLVSDYICMAGGMVAGGSRL